MIIAAFLCLGFLIGNLVGLSAQSTVTVILPLLFAFVGGSGAAFLHKLGDADRKLAAAAVTALSVGCLLGIYGGIAVSERQWFTPEAQRHLAEGSSVASRKLLMASDLDSVALIDQQYKTTKQLTAEQAYERLYRLVVRREAP